MNPDPMIDAILLAGGQGTRMNGADKGLVNWKGRPLVWWTIGRIKPQVNHLVISANRNTQRYREFGFPVVGDKRADFQGPMAGIEACAPLCRAPFTLIVACDSPNLPVNLADKLKSSLLAKRANASYVTDGDRAHYLACMVRSDALTSVAQYLDSGQRSVRAWLSELNAIPTTFEGASKAFLNINQLEKNAKRR